MVAELGSRNDASHLTALSARRILSKARFDVSEQLWGTYSVADHCNAYPFVADLVLYDRLVVPVPPGGDKMEWERWRDKG